MATRGPTVIETKGTTATRHDRASARTLLEQYECGPVAFSGTPSASYERRLVLDHIVTTSSARSDLTRASASRPWLVRSVTCCRSAG